VFASHQNRWWIVIASMLALMVASGNILVFSFALFLKPMTEALGVGRSVLTFGLLIAQLLCGLGTPLVGVLADRFTVRAVLLLGIPSFAITIAAAGFLSSSLLFMYLMFAAIGLAGAAQNSAPYAKIISLWFDSRRGLALGVSMSGMGLGVVLLPELIEHVIETFGWRLGFAALAGAILLLAYVPVLLFANEPPSTRPATSHGSMGRVAGVSAAEAFGDWRFWSLSGGFFFAAVATHGTMAHFIAILTDQGLSVQRATATMASVGGAMIVGRIIGGHCLDRFAGPTIAACFFIIPAIGIGMLATGSGSFSPFLIAGCCGIGIGAQVGTMAFFASRYFGLRAYGQIFGTMFGIFLAGTGVGPFVHGLSYDLLHSYQPTLLGSAFFLMCIAGVFPSLGDYRYAARKAAPAELAGATAAQADVP
jgi:MFS family permease